MKKSRFSEEQISAVLKEHQAGIAVVDIFRKHGISDAVVSRMWWKLPSSGLRACNDGSSQAARSRDIGSRGWDRVSQPSTFRIWI